MNLGFHSIYCIKEYSQSYCVNKLSHKIQLLPEHQGWIKYFYPFFDKIYIFLHFTQIEHFPSTSFIIALGVKNGVIHYSTERTCRVKILNLYSIEIFGMQIVFFLWSVFKRCNLIKSIDDASEILQHAKCKSRVKWNEIVKSNAICKSKIIFHPFIGLFDKIKCKCGMVLFRFNAIIKIML